VTIAPDVSYFQPPVNDSFPHRWLIFRGCDGAFVDPNVKVNLAWCQKAKAAGRIDGFTVYVVYRPGLNVVILAILDRLGIPADCVVMIDAETWGGQIRGDQSAGLNQLAGALATRQGSRNRVWGYANRGDFASMWPTRPTWLGCVLASYGGSKPSMPRMVGWQYTNGQYFVTGKPSSSAPFGPCDHNELYLTSTAPDAASVTPLDTTHPKQVEDDEMILILNGGNGGKSAFFLSGGKALISVTNAARQAHVAAGGRVETWPAEEFNRALVVWS
jgi:hypothetical protein